VRNRLASLESELSVCQHLLLIDGVTLVAKVFLSV
jgi:hypothetical protein